jgi:hypothetical protein
MAEERLSFLNKSLPLLFHALFTSEHLEANEYKLNTSSILLFDSPEIFIRTQHRIIFKHGSIIEDIQVVAHKNYTNQKKSGHKCIVDASGLIVIFALLAVSVVAFECAPMLMKKFKSLLKEAFDACFSCYIVVKFIRMKRMM